MEKRAAKRPKRRYPEAERVIVECEQARCIHCGVELVDRRPWHMRKTVQTLKGPLFVAGKSKRCANPDCEHTGQHYYATGVLTLSLPNSTYGLDVLAYIGWRHEHDHRQLVEIHQELTGKGVEINERNVGKLYRQFLALLGGMSEQTAGKVEQTASDHGGLIWAIDALQPEGNGGLLYVLYEALSGTPVSAIQLASGTEERLVDWLKPFAELPFKALATLSDGEKAIIAALKSSWPTAPHQRCQLHFLNNLAEPVLKVDSQLSKLLKDDLGDVSAPPAQTERIPTTAPEAADDRQIKGKSAPRDPELLAIEAEIRMAVKDALNHKSRKPFHWAGLTGYQQLEAVAQALATVPADEPETAYLHRLATQVTQAVAKNRVLANDLKQAHRQLKSIAGCLRYLPASSQETNAADHDSNNPTPQPSSQTIAAEMKTLMDNFQPDHKRHKAQSALHRAWHRTWDAFGSDLLHSYDIPGLPADNLGMEALFGRLRRHQRRISGRKSTGELRNFGHYQVLFLADSQQDLLHQMQLVPTNTYLEHRRRLAEAEKPRQLLHRLHRNPAQTLDRLLEQHYQRRQQVAHPPKPDKPYEHRPDPTPSRHTTRTQYGNLTRTIPAFIRKLFAFSRSDNEMPDALSP